jgi:NAD(P)-dependent dehydrogenase (short-subunit alcohol dehydrogenase family)
MKHNLKERVAAVTGRARALAKQLLAHSRAALWPLDRERAAVEKVASALADASRAARAVIVDDAATVSAASEWDHVVRVIVAGIKNCVKAALSLMTGQHHRCIVNIASVPAMRARGSIGSAIYGATKASVAALSLGLARELGPQGIIVNAVAPGIADTAMRRSTLTEDRHRRVVSRTPLGRLATLSDYRKLGDVPRLRLRFIHHRSSHSGRRWLTASHNRMTSI